MGLIRLIYLFYLFIYLLFSYKKLLKLKSGFIGNIKIIRFLESIETN